MKVLLFLVAVLAVTASGHISDNQKYELNAHMGHVAHKHQLGTLLNNNKNVVKAQYDYSTHGGAVGDISITGVTIPINALVTRAWLDVLTQPASSGNTASVAVKVQGAADLYAATSVGSLTAGRKDGIPQDAASQIIKLTAERTPAITVSTQALTAGKINIFIEYMVSDS